MTFVLSDLNVLKYIHDCDSIDGRPPTIREISEIFYIEPHVVNSVIKRLEEKGYLRVVPNVQRARFITQAGKEALRNEYQVEI